MRLLERVREFGEKIVYYPGQKIIQQGQQNNHFYLIESGRVNVFVEGAERVRLVYLDSGDYFGEVSCLTGEVISASYGADGEVILRRTDREGLFRLLKEFPVLNRNIIETLCKKIRQGDCRDSFSEVPALYDEETRALPEQRSRPAVGLALGAGGVRGMAHIGVAKVLKQNKIPIDMIAGTSAGALVGSCLASGMGPFELEVVVKGLRWSKIATPVWPPRQAFLNNEKMGQLLDRFIGNREFKDLTIPLAVVATDANTGEEVVIGQGKVSDAVRASTAIPAIFEPVKLFGRDLVDGATVNAVPASVCRAMGADIVIAVSVGDFKFESGPPKNIVMTILHYTDMMLKKQVELQENRWADVVIRVKRPHLSGYNFREAREFIKEGERVAALMVPRIKGIIKTWSK